MQKMAWKIRRALWLLHQDYEDVCFQITKSSDFSLRGEFADLIDNLALLLRLLFQDVEFVTRVNGPFPSEAEITYVDEDPVHSSIEGASWIGEEPFTPEGKRLKSSCTGVISDTQIGELPLFPISTVLLPGSELPVQIFPEKSETQAMFKGLRDGGRLGVVLADYDRLGGSFARVGCQARVADLTELDDGRLIVETAGVRRFRILSVAQWRPHIVATVQYIDDADAAAGEDQPPTAAERAEDGAETASADVDAVERECWQALQARRRPPAPPPAAPPGFEQSLCGEPRGEEDGGGEER